MKFIIISTLLGAVMLMSSWTIKQSDPSIATAAVDDVRLHTKLFIQSTAALKKSISLIDAGNQSSVLAARKALKNSRYQYKCIEYFMEYFFKSSAHIYNSPATIEVEEPELEYEEPVGFQVMENLLYKSVNTGIKKKLIEQAEAVETSAKDIPALFYNFKVTDQQILESIRQELIRVMTLNITGYDAPLLKSGITESIGSLRAMQMALKPQKNKTTDDLLTDGILYLKNHQDFDSFSRMQFLTRYALPLQKQLGGNLFSRNFFKVESFYKESTVPNADMIILGKQLFFDKSISGNGLRSCASCHQPEKYFTDGRSKSLTLDGHASIARNTPTLLYAAYQYSQDWDGRARSLEDQVVNVMQNKDEMNADSALVIQKLKQNTYAGLIAKAFQSPQSVSIQNLSVAIAAYLRTLAPFNSALDRYINGEREAMNVSQINGFNLFMGKAQCGTCHFAPLFNGLVPPDYKTTEYEVLGVPLTDNFKKSQHDPDLGRYTSYPTKYYKGAFKTPTVRNIAKTGPYMHNGNFHTLEKVIEFYNQGGGNGIGLNIADQTLASDPLKLSPSEITDIVAFLQTLTDHN